MPSVESAHAYIKITFTNSVLTLRIIHSINQQENTEPNRTREVTVHDFFRTSVPKFRTEQSRMRVSLLISSDIFETVRRQIKKTQLDLH